MAATLWLLGGAGPDARRTTAWFAIHAADGQLIGRQHDYDVAIAGGVRHTVERELAFTVEGHPPTRIATRIERDEDADGQTVAFRIARGGGVSTQILIERGKAVVTRTSGRNRQRFAIDLPPGIRFQDGRSPRRRVLPRSTGSIRLRSPWSACLSRPPWGRTPGG